MQIAPGIDASVWHALKLDDPASADWDKAVDILAARIRDRYIGPLDFLIAAEEDSRELYYIGPGKTLFAVPIAPSGRGLEVGQPRALFRPPILSPPRDRDCCDVNRDGTEFFVVTETRPEASELVVISHWER